MRSKNKLDFHFNAALTAVNLTIQDRLSAKGQKIFKELLNYGKVAA
jgi:hypothetical protein